MTLSWMTIVPELPMIVSTTPFQASRPAKVTTKLGTPIFANQKPCSKPMAAPAPSAAASATAVDVWLPSGTKSVAAITPPMPLTKPIDRSISPSSRTNTTPMPMTMTADACAMRLTKLPAVRKCEFRDWK